MDDTVRLHETVDRRPPPQSRLVASLVDAKHKAETDSNRLHEALAASLTVGNVAVRAWNENAEEVQFLREQNQKLREDNASLEVEKNLAVQQLAAVRRELADIKAKLGTLSKEQPDGDGGEVSLHF